jgi:hypothetical protein
MINFAKTYGFFIRSWFKELTYRFILEKQMSDTDKGAAITAGAAGAAGAVGSVGTVAAAGSVAGLGAAGITSGLAAVGSVVGGGMAAGLVITAAAPIAAAGLGYGLYKWLKK